MKLRFSKSAGRLRAKSLPFLAGLLLSPLAVMATDSGYTNTTTIIYAPGYSGNTVPSIQVDATNFVNLGTWDIDTDPALYHTANTLNYINEGAMYGWVGWDFALYPSTTGQRGMSASFFNDISGIIRASDLPIINPETEVDYSYPVSYLWISATNIINKGQLIGDTGGEIRLTGSYVNLARSTVGIGAFVRGSSSIIGGTNFYPATAIYDEYWQQTNTFPNSTTPYALNSATIWDGTNASSPTFYVYAPCGGLNGAMSIGFKPTFSDSMNIPGVITNVPYTNSYGLPASTQYPVPIFRQAVFVGISDTNHIHAANVFLDTGNPTNLFETAIVRLKSASDTLYLEDALASADSTFLTNRGLLLNIGTPRSDNPLTPCTDPTYRPANYNLEGADSRFANGFPGVGKPAASFLYNANGTALTNMSVQATYAGYSAYIDNLVRRRYGSTVPTWQGRIIINADGLDLTKTTINNQYGSEITIQANHLISSTGAVVSCRNLSYNLGSTNGNLNVTNLVSTSASTLFYGTNMEPIYAFSALWTNGYPVEIQNYSPSNWDETITNITGCPAACVTNTVTVTHTNWVPAFFTNFAEVDLHVLLVDATSLSTTEPVTNQDLILHSTNMLNGSVNVERTLLFDGQNLTLQGNLTLSGDLQNWTHANAPNLRYFTNNGVLIIPQDAHFGDDGPTNYAAFVNNGAITNGGGEMINSDYFQNSGTLYALGGVFVTTSTGLVANASIISGGDVDFTGGALKLTHAIISADNRLNFNLTNALYDASPSAGNSLACGNGFNLLSKPTLGDLLGTTITSVRWDGAEVDHVWAGVDRGATQPGFSNNVAIGTLVLDDYGVPASEPLFVFKGASTTPGVTNGLYVNNLDLSSLVDLDNEIQVDPNLVIYYINVIGTTAGHLTSVFPGRFVHAAVTAVGYQPSIRSPQLSASISSGQQFQFTVNDAVAGQTYTVEASTNLPADDWVPIFTTNAPLDGLFQFVIPDVPSYPTRFYRLVTSP
jgi:hypothetical protein